MNLFIRLPFTLAMLFSLITAGLYGRSHLGLLDPGLHASTAHSMRLVVEGEIHRIFTSLFFTAGGWRFYSSIAMFGLSVGFVEWNFGTIRSAGTFFGVHVATLVVMAIVVLVTSQIAATYRGNLLWHVQDVGPSAGYYGCLGLAIASLAFPVRWPIIAAIASVLIARVTWSCIHLPEDGRMLSADLAHLIAFPLGILTSRL